ncbi:MAG: hypothetical protein KDK07_06730 [Bauldia sp.]|nr:hypothetical protein [Bauldia sp.]
MRGGFSEGVQTPDAQPTYIAEFDFRYNRRTKLGLRDAMHTDGALKA